MGLLDSDPYLSGFAPAGYDFPASDDAPPAYAGPEDWTGKTGLWGTSDKPVYPWGKMDGVKGLVLHHTGDNHSQEQGIDDINENDLGAHFRMDREGNVVRLAPDNAVMQHMRNGWGAGKGYGNRNLHGLEVAAYDDSDLTDAQRENIPKFVAWHAAQNGYDPTRTVFGHEEVNPGHRTNEMGDIAAAIRGGEPLPAAAQLTTRAALGGPQTKMPDEATDQQEPGFLGKLSSAVNKLYTNPAFLGGLAMMNATPTVMGGNPGETLVHGVQSAGNLGIAQDEHQNVMQQRAQRQRIWNTQLFPKGQPNFNHPLLKDVPPELVQAAAAGGADEGLPLLQKYSLASAQQKLEMQMFARRAQMVDEFLRKQQEEGQPPQQAAPPQPQPAPAPAPAPAVPPQGAPVAPPQPPQPQMLPPANPVVPGLAVQPPQAAMPGGKPQPSPGFVPPGMPGRVPGLGSRDYSAGQAALVDPNVRKALVIDQLLGDKTGRGASNIINQALVRAQAPEQAGKSAYMTALGKAEGERRAANVQMHVPLATMEHLEDIVRNTDPKILNAATGPYMGDNKAQAMKSLLMPTKRQADVYNLNTELHHLIHSLQKQLREGGGTDQDQAIAGKAMGMFMNVKNDPQKMLEIINDAKNMIRATGGEMPQYLKEKYKSAPAYERGGPAGTLPPGYKIRRIDKAE